MRRWQFVELDVDPAEPVLVRSGTSEGVLQLGIIDDPSLLEIDEEHLARLQAPFLDDPLLGNRQHARFRRHHHEVVVGDQVAGRTQAVAVERGADLATIGESDRRRSVPRLDHRRVVLVERAALLVHQRVRFPRLGNQHHHRMRQRVAAHHQQFQRVVERCRVGLSRVDQWPDLLEVAGQQGRRCPLLARAHPIVIAAQRVDLAVVCNHPEGMRQLPRREGIGREALVDQRHRRNATRVPEVGIVLANLISQQQALVDDRPRRHRRLVELLAMLESERADRVCRPAADDVQLALQGIGDHHIRPTADEDLADHRLARTHCRRHRHRSIDRHIAPAEHHLMLRANGALDFLLACQARRRLLRQEHHTHAIVAGRWQLDALARHLGTKEIIGKLDQDPGAVTHQGIGADRAAVIEVLQDQQPLLDDRVTLLAPDLRDETDATCVVLVGRVVEALPFWYGGIHHSRILTKLRRYLNDRSRKGRHLGYDAAARAAPRDPRLYPECPAETRCCTAPTGCAKASGLHRDGAPAATVATISEIQADRQEEKQNPCRTLRRPAPAHPSFARAG
ncbi:MAG: hypothetical protein AW07_00779 [Candidatus Accumulibacter sp. SK-11]|nr:MAG: hypothetical protein AW07_00779 [Candidatus Accumulibacter sp. SK-11]